MNKSTQFNQLIVFLIMALFWTPTMVSAQNNRKDNIAAKPLFRDPIYDGAADPTVIWNQKEKKNGSCFTPIVSPMHRGSTE